MKKLFSERYGYTKPSDVIIREQITREIQNAICSVYDQLEDIFNATTYIERRGYAEYKCMRKYLWVHFLNERDANMPDDDPVATKFIEDSTKEWYKKLDLIEFSIEYLINNNTAVADEFVKRLNSEFERLHFAYRIIDYKIVEIHSKEEILSIEIALEEAPPNIRMHLSKALELYSKRPRGDYRNSIKESISAVEAWCRGKTGENTLGKALNRLEQSGMVIPAILKQAFEKLYAYTNDPTTGIRHSSMDENGQYIPKAEEAMFMLVSCSTFINYLNKKV